MGGPLLLCLFLALASICFLYLTGKRRSEKNLPPGEMGLPWIGETIDFYRAQRRNRLFEDFVEPRTKKYGNVFKTTLMGHPTVVVNGAEANRFFLSNEFKLVVSSWPKSAVQLLGNDSIMQMDGNRYRWIRGAVLSCLSGAALEAFLPKLCGSIREHLDTHWQGRETVQLFNSVKLLTFSVMLEGLFGIKAEERLLEMFEEVQRGVFAAAINLPGFQFWKAKKARREIQKLLESIVREKKRRMERWDEKEEEEEGIVMSRLIKGMIDGELREEEVVDNVVLLVIAAHDTTTSAITMICRTLAQHPDCYSRLLQEHLEILRKKKGQELTKEDIQKMNYTWRVSRESMRLQPPIFGSFRKAMVDIDYLGFTIPKGWKLLWTAHGTHHDPEYFPEPQRFDPSRFEATMAPYAYIPFGGGARLCAGYQLAKLNILAFIHFMVTRYNWSPIDPVEPVAVDPIPIPLKGMPIRITQRRVSQPASHSICNHFLFSLGVYLNPAMSPLYLLISQRLMFFLTPSPFVAQNFDFATIACAILHTPCAQHLLLLQVLEIDILNVVGFLLHIGGAEVGDGSSRDCPMTTPNMNTDCLPPWVLRFQSFVALQALGVYFLPSVHPSVLDMEPPLTRDGPKFQFELELALLRLPLLNLLHYLLHFDMLLCSNACRCGMLK
ncbi:taxadiene 5-alpha hydroxylase-like [Aristolochia californica]|uniref:taxadiene 5-alpha hydroxylase-like n=1 Tax=Aristolochia californica TaxID=171875 RepID=UPI0035E21EB4